MPVSSDKLYGQLARWRITSNETPPEGWTHVALTIDLRHPDVVGVMHPRDFVVANKTHPQCAGLLAGNIDMINASKVSLGDTPIKTLIYFRVLPSAGATLRDEADRRWWSIETARRLARNAKRSTEFFGCEDQYEL